VSGKRCAVPRAADDLFNRKGIELRDRIAVLKEQLDRIDMTRGEQADHAVRVFELSQRLTEQWLPADYAAKRQILDIVFSNFRLDGVSLCYTMRKPFALLCEGLLVPNSGEDRIPVELFVAAAGEVSF
jgi:site-specific DNA recombinase